MDAQGIELPKPYIKQHGATFPCLLDQYNFFNRAFGLKAIPNVFLIDENGIVRLVNPKDKHEAVEKLFLDEGVKQADGELYESTGVEDADALAARVDAAPDDVALRLRLADIFCMKRDFDGARPHYEAVVEKHPKHTEALFGLGILKLEAGDKAGAADAWRAALEEDKWNFVVRKQIWAIEHPEQFYEEKIDYGWQKEQMAREGLK